MLRPRDARQLARPEQGELDREPGASPGAGALGGDLASVQLDDVAHDREAQAETAVAPPRAVPRLLEGLEDVGQERGFHPDPGVGDAHLHVGLRAPQGDLDAAALGGELDRVGEQVPHHLLEPFRIARDQARPLVQDELQPDLLGVARRALRFHRGPDHGRQVDRSHVEPELARGDSRDVDQVVDQLRQGDDVAFDDFEPAVELLLLERAAAKQLGPREDRRQGVAQLVRDGREELVLQVTRRLLLLQGGGGAGPLLLGESAHADLLPIGAVDENEEQGAQDQCQHDGHGRDESEARPGSSRRGSRGLESSGRRRLHVRREAGQCLLECPPAGPHGGGGEAVPRPPVARRACSNASWKPRSATSTWSTRDRASAPTARACRRTT